MEPVSEFTEINYLCYRLKSGTLRKGEEYSNLAVAAEKNKFW